MLVANYSLSHLSDGVLLHDLRALIDRDRSNTANLLAHIAEVDARKLYLPAGYPSMYTYCVGELRLSEDSAAKRIQAARKGREYPELFAAMADGRLSLTSIGLLCPWMKADNATELISEAAGKSKFQIQELLARRFPTSETFPLACAVPIADSQHAPAHVGASSTSAEKAQTRVSMIKSTVTPVAPQRFSLPLSMSQEMYDKLRYAQELLGHQIPGGDLSAVVHRALDALISRLEKQKFAATDRPRGSRKQAENPRSIPAHVKRAVWQRDRGQCTFVSASGHRCEGRERLEFDHVVPVARGGEPTVEGMRLLCRAHNQYAATCAFGQEFMEGKRAEAQETRASKAGLKPTSEEVIPYLLALGIRKDRARHAAALCEDIPHASLEERVKLALSCFGRGTRIPAPKTANELSISAA